MANANMLRELLIGFDYKQSTTICGSDTDIFAELVQRIVNHQQLDEGHMMQADDF